MSTQQSHVDIKQSEVTILIHDIGMTRDCWFETDINDPGKQVFILRQVKFSPDGQSAVTAKQFRIPEDQLRKIFTLLGKVFK